MQPTIAEKQRIEIVSDPGAMLSLRPDWERLAATRDPVFAQFDWNSAWWEHVGCKPEFWGSKDLYILVARSGSRVTAIAPFIIRRAVRYGVAVRKVERLGLRFSDYNDPLLAEDQVGADALLQQLRHDFGRWDIVDLSGLRTDTGSMECLRSASEKAGLKCSFERDNISPYLPLPDSEDELRRSPNWSKIAKADKALRKLAADGVRPRILTGDPPPAVFDQMVQLERAKQGQALLGDARPFFDAILPRLASSGCLYVALLEQGERVLAYNLGFLANGSIRVYNIAHHRDLAPHSPGRILIGQLVRFGIENGYRELDFLSGGEGYKWQWTQNYRETVRCFISHSAPTSRVVAWACKMRAGIQNRVRRDADRFGRSN